MSRPLGHQKSLISGTNTNESAIGILLGAERLNTETFQLNDLATTFSAAEARNSGTDSGTEGKKKEGGQAGVFIPQA